MNRFCCNSCEHQTFTLRFAQRETINVFVNGSDIATAKILSAFSSHQGSDLVKKATILYFIPEYKLGDS